MFQIGIFQNLFMELRYGVRVVHFSGGRGREHVLIIGMLVVLLNQEIYRVLRDGHSADGGFSLGAGECQFSVGVADVLLADKDRFVPYIQVIPEESNQFAFPESADQRQVEHREESSGIRCVQVGFHILWPESLSLELLDLRSDAVIGRVTRDQPLFNRPLEGAVEHEVDAADCGAAQAGALAFPDMDTSIFHEIFIHFLKVAGGQLGEFDLADTRDGIGFNHQLAAVRCGEADVGFGVEIVPGFQPGGDSVFLGADYIEVLGFFQHLCQLLLNFGLGSTENIFDDAFAGDGIVSGGVATLPAAIASLADISLAWSEKAREKKAACEEGKISFEEFAEWLSNS